MSICVHRRAWRRHVNACDNNNDNKNNNIDDNDDDGLMKMITI